MGCKRGVQQVPGIASRACHGEQPIMRTLATGSSRGRESTEAHSPWRRSSRAAPLL